MNFFFGQQDDDDFWKRYAEVLYLREFIADAVALGIARAFQGDSSNK